MGFAALWHRLCWANAEPTAEPCPPRANCLYSPPVLKRVYNLDTSYFPNVCFNRSIHVFCVWICLFVFPLLCNRTLLSLLTVPAPHQRFLAPVPRSAAPSQSRATAGGWAATLQWGLWCVSSAAPATYCRDPAASSASPCLERWLSGTSLSQPVWVGVLGPGLSKRQNGTAVRARKISGSFWDG